MAKDFQDIHLLCDTGGIRREMHIDDYCLTLYTRELLLLKIHLPEKLSKTLEYGNKKLNEGTVKEK